MSDYNEINYINTLVLRGERVDSIFFSTAQTRGNIALRKPCKLSNFVIFYHAKEIPKVFFSVVFTNLTPSPPRDCKAHPIRNKVKQTTMVGGEEGAGGNAVL